MLSEGVRVMVCVWVGRVEVRLRWMCVGEGRRGWMNGEMLERGAVGS